MNSIRYTPEQRAAIDDRGGDLLVSAAAGSGKTKVLVERLLDQVEAGADVSQFLIITYTRAAAAELRGKILEEIGRRNALSPTKHLRRQSALVYGADIGTIHAFCGRVIREFAHVLGINPDFRTADEGESGLILHQVLEDVLEERYSRMDDYPGFALLADTVSSGRNDRMLEATVLETHTKLLSHPYPDVWAGEQIARLDTAGKGDAGETVWGEFLLDRARAAAGYWLEEMGRARPLVAGDEKLERAYGESWDETLDGLGAFRRALDLGWDEAHSCGPIPFPRPKPVAGFDGLKDLRRRCKGAMDKVTGEFELTTGELFADLDAVRPVITALVELVLDLDRAYGREKERRGLMDFSDLEHQAIRLLVDRETGAPTEAARTLSGRYREVMVDEFQDVSGLQDMIFRALGEYGSRRFMVGDVKQSIYRFRLADPTIFLGYYRRLPDRGEAEDGAGRKVLLGKNFRSRPGILDAVNFIFRRIMSETFGEMDYGDREALYPGLTETGDEGNPVELHVIDLKDLPDDGGDDREMAEPRLVAARIREKHDREGYAWRDFAILLRSTKGKTARYERALEEAGIPVAKTGGEDFFYTAEVATVLSLLSVILNPLQDVHLIGVLRSPLFCFTPDELADIRCRDRSATFYEALRLAAGDSEKCARFLDTLARFRDTAPDMPSDRFLWHLMTETNALSIFGAMDRGESRRKNLLALLAYARRVEAGGYRGLFSFVALLEKRMETGSVPELTAAGEGGDTVTIMSIHKSKGLEFPVVILPDLAKGFNIQDTHRQILVHPGLGLGSVRRDLDRKIRYSTLARSAISKKLRQETLAEELRILYVGMTRARDCLIMTCALKNAEKTIGELAPNATDPVSPYVLENAPSMAHWVLLAALGRPEAGPLLGEAAARTGTGSAGWNISMISMAETISESTQETGERSGESPLTPPISERIQTTDLPPELTCRLTYTYPRAEAVDLPSKLTATELKGRGLDLEAEEEAVPYSRTPPAPIFRRPDFILGERPLTGAERGTATHLVMQYIDFTRCGDLLDIQAEIGRLAELGHITREQAAVVDPWAIGAFFDSELGRRVLAAEHLRREFKFSLLAPAEKFFPCHPGEQVLLQGVVDCYLEEPQGLTVLDFKTDYVPAGGLREKAEQYRGQVSAYAYALERITGRPVREAFLYFFSLGESVAL